MPLNAERPFGDWDLNIPRIETATVAKIQGGNTGWITNSRTIGTRCSDFGVPAAASPIQGGNPWDADQWWYGYHLILPGVGSQDLMARSASNALTPAAGTSTYTIVTKQNWMISCTASTAADDGGQGFIALAPDGTQYTFTHLVYRPMATMTEPLGTAPEVARADATGVKPMSASSNLLERNDAFMYVTQVVDRFGNSLTYSYNNANGNLTGITASDGRSISITYDSTGYLIKTITANAFNVASRTWTYAYNTNNSALPLLASVTLPDGSAWSYNLGAFQTDAPTYNDGDCTGNTLPTSIGVTATGSITHPSGLSATFTLQGMLHGRSYVPKACWGPAGSTDLPYYQYPEYYIQPTITSKVFTGAGLPTETWTYSYSSPNQSYAGDPCYSAGTCASTVYTDVLDPNGNDVRYTYSNRYDATEGQLLNTTSYSGAAGGTVLRAETNTYANPTGGPWPTQYGIDVQGRTNTQQTEELAPLQMRQIQEEGDTYTWQAVAYDGYANPTDVKRYSSAAGQTPIEETTTYLNDSALWVLDLPQTVVNNTRNETELSNVYNSSDLLQTRSRFGEFMMSYTYNSAGQLASFTDGDSNTTNISNYYRGIPQEIDYPDGTQQLLTVDDLGQITSVTDQNNNVTQYSYDPIGRISQITYPTDTVSWYPKTFTYTFVNTAERGVPAGHWDRVTSVGSDVTTTYFDADLRPVLSDQSNGSQDITTATAYDWTGATTLSSYPVYGTPAISTVTTGTHHTYDALERLTQTQEDSELGPLTTTTSYVSNAGQQVTDPKNNVTTTYYQVFDEPSYQAPMQVNAPAGVSQSIVRDIYGHPTSITQSGAYGSENDSLTKTLVYDQYYRLCRTTEPESGSMVMAYDNANNLAWSAQGQAITDGSCGQTDVVTSAQTVRTYDQMNRVLSITPPVGTQDTNYTYDGVGNIVAVSTELSQLQTLQQFTYNTRNMLTTETLHVAPYTWALGYSYDAYGHANAVAYPSYNGTNEGVAYSPDPFGRVTQIGSYASGITYFSNNQVAGFNYGSGATYAAQQNMRQLLNNFSYGVGGSASLAEGLIYDANGNITNINDNANGPRTKAFTYDALNRLASATASNLYGAETYTYDALNNLRTRLTGGNALTFNYNANDQLASVSQGASTITTYGYDAQGNRNTLSSGGTTTTYSFDTENQLLQVSGVESYMYDAAGRRVTKTGTNGAVTAYYLYDQAGQLMYEFDPGTATGTNYVYVGSKLIAKHAMQQLAAPTGVTVSSNPNNGQFTVSWNAVPDATSYTLETTSGTGSTTVVYSGSTTSTAQTVTTGGVVFYQLQACNSSGCSTGSPFSVSVWPAIPTVSISPVATTYNGPYTVTWTTPPGASTYTVQEALNGGAWTTIASNTAQNSIARPGTTSGTYTYQVSASNRQVAGTAGWGTSPAVTVNTSYGVPPTVPAAFSVPSTNYTGSVTLTWGASTPVVTNYVLQQSLNGGSWTTVPTSGTNTSVTLSGLGDGTYKYQLEACNDTGGGSACSAMTTGGPMVVTLPPSPAPSLSATANSANGTYIVSWTGNNEATSYTVQMQVNGGAWSTVQTGTGTAYDAVGQTDATYSYRVEACNAAPTCSPWSNTVNTSVLLPPASPPTLSGGGTSNTGSYGLSWNAVANATYYAFKENANGAGWTTVQSSGATSWSTSGRGNGTYQYLVYACNGNGCSSSYSNVVTETVSLIPGTPTLSLSMAYSGGNKYTEHVTWAAMPTATSYAVQVQTSEGTSGPYTTSYTQTATTWSQLYTSATNFEVRVQACNSVGCSAWSQWYGASIP